MATTEGSRIDFYSAIVSGTNRFTLFTRAIRLLLQRTMNKPLGVL